MFANQFERCFIVVECVQVFNLMERNFGMAFFAVLSEPVFMHIGMAGITVIEFQIAESLYFFAIFSFGFMTFFTCYGFMFPE